MKKPNTIIYCTCSVDTTRNLARPEKGEAYGRLFQQIPTPLVPTHYGFGHPFRETFVPERAVEQLGPAWRGKGSDAAYLRWQGDLKGYMHIDTKRWEKAAFHSVAMHVEYDDLVKSHLLDAYCNLFRSLVEFTEAAYGGMTIRAAFRGDTWHEGYTPETVEQGGISIGPYSGVMQTNVPSLSPGLYWLTVLGRERLDALGDQAETLAEFGKTWRDAAGRLWVQAAERPEQMHVPETRERIQRVIDRIATSPAEKREPTFDRSEIHLPPPPPIALKGGDEFNYFLPYSKARIPWAAPSERIPIGTVAYGVLEDLIAAGRKHRAGLGAYGVTMTAGERYLRLLTTPERYRTQEALLSAVIGLLRAEAADGKTWGVGWCAIEASCRARSGSPTSGVLRMHAEASAVPYPHEPIAYDASIHFTKKGRTIAFGELYAERGVPSIFG